MQSVREIIEEIATRGTPPEDAEARRRAERAIRDANGDVHAAYRHLVDAQTYFLGDNGDREIASDCLAAARWMRDRWLTLD